MELERGEVHNFVLADGRLAERVEYMHFEEPNWEMWLDRAREVKREGKIGTNPAVLVPGREVEKAIAFTTLGPDPDWLMDDADAPKLSKKRKGKERAFLDTPVTGEEGRPMKKRARGSEEVSDNANATRTSQLTSVTHNNNTPTQRLQCLHEGLKKGSNQDCLQDSPTNDGGIFDRGHSDLPRIELGEVLGEFHRKRTVTGGGTTRFDTNLDRRKRNGLHLDRPAELGRDTASDTRGSRVVEIYQPVMEGRSLPTESSQEKAAVTIGAFLTSVRECEFFLKAGMPFWLVRSAEHHTITWVDEQVNLTTPALLNICSDEVMSHKKDILYHGPLRDLQKAVAVEKYGLAIIDYSNDPFAVAEATDPFAASPSNPSTSQSASSNGPSKVEKEEGEATQTFKSKPKSSFQPQAERDKFVEIRGPYSPEIPDVWVEARASINRSRQPGQNEIVNRGYAFPDRGYVLNIPPEKM
ncbi:hypothetical protein AAF712_005679 [Marasmius tenuissimus]|uniref:Uncharacterized protein n=1 Tax=Marasmius tenuissimus TaxID=585030 RepID=A0ABR2ZZV3_9AGAR